MCTPLHGTRLLEKEAQTRMHQGLEWSQWCMYESDTPEVGPRPCPRRRWIWSFQDTRACNERLLSKVGILYKSMSMYNTDKDIQRQYAECKHYPYVANMFLRERLLFAENMIAEQTLREDARQNRPRMPESVPILVSGTACKMHGVCRAVPRQIRRAHGPGLSSPYIKATYKSAAQHVTGAMHTRDAIRLHGVF